MVVFYPQILEIFADFDASQENSPVFTCQTRYRANMRGLAKLGLGFGCFRHSLWRSIRVGLVRENGAIM